MALPFSRQAFYGIFAAYNTALWPAPWVLFALALATVVMLVGLRAAGRVAGGSLAVLWAWMAVAYHLVFFTRINPAAWLFGALFLVAAGVFAWQAIAHPWTLEVRTGPRAVLGWVLVSYALGGYPFVGLSFGGHAYPELPTFGLPCPTTIFTLGVLSFVRGAPWMAAAVPLAWSLVGTVAAVKLGVVQDYGLPVAALLTVLGWFAAGERRVQARA